MEYAAVRAPFDGIVTRRLVDTGAFIQSAASGQPMPLLTVMRDDRKRIVIDIPESEANLVRVGQSATFRAHSLGDRPLPGKVARLADALEPSTRTMRTEVELDNPSEVRLGAYGSATITLADESDALSLPSNALLIAGDGAAVMLATDGQARRRKVRTGFDDGVRTQITAGLEGTEAVIVEGKDSVSDGQAIRVTSPE